MTRSGHTEKQVNFDRLEGLRRSRYSCRLYGAVPPIRTATGRLRADGPRRSLLI
jgi:hypothetical protein